jgi:bifunctional non-homologous end joining protein LigD
MGQAAGVSPERRSAGRSSTGETRDDVALTNLDQPLFAGAEATKRDLVDYLDAVRDRILPVLAGRALSVIRVLRGQDAFMQKNVPKYTPNWVPTVTAWSQTSHREVRYAVCGDRRTLLWFANQRAIEYHVPLFRGIEWDRPTHLVLDLDPPDDASGPEAFAMAAAAAHLVRRVLDDVGMASVAKTSGAKGVHVFVPLDAGPDAGPDAVSDAMPTEDVAAATRAIAARAERLDPVLATTVFVRDERGRKVFLDATRAGGATVVAAYSPRVRPGVPVSFPVPWAQLETTRPADHTIRTAAAALGDTDPWRDLMPPPQQVDAGLIAEGRTIPVARVQAMHEGKRRARARRAAEENSAGP